jgi:hypothetical protein
VLAQFLEVNLDRLLSSHDALVICRLEIVMHDVAAARQTPSIAHDAFRLAAAAESLALLQCLSSATSQTGRSAVGKCGEAP